MNATDTAGAGPASSGQEAVFAPFVGRYLKMCAAHGIPEDEQLAETGLTRRQINPPGGWVGRDVIELLARHRLTRQANPVLGRHLAAAMADPADAGLLGFICLSCPSIQELHSALVEFGGLASNMFSTTLVHEPGLVLWRVDIHAADTLVARDCTEWFLAWCAALIRRLDAGALLEARLGHGPLLANGRAQAEYEAAFSCPVRFHQQRSALVLDPASLAWQSPRGNPVAFDALRRQARVVLEQLYPERSLVHRVRQEVRLLLAQKRASRDEVCRRIGISSRHLHRRLQRHDSSYQQILDQVRAEQAPARLAEPGIDLQQLATELGFSGVKSFSRWFAARFGTTPADYRRSRQ